MKLQNALYLIPTSMSDAPLGDVMPAANADIIAGVRHFIVENVREARRFIKKCNPAADISAMTFFELNRHTEPSEVAAALEPLRAGEPMGLMSDAGCPAVADPGALAVAKVHEEGMTVIPLIGPSSILLSLMASGFSGQGFSFVGYLPIAENERIAAIKNLEGESRRRQMTQIFIETPYRNDKMLRCLAQTLSPETKLCVACDITSPQSESIRTLKIAQWRKEIAVQGDKPLYDKRPAIFLIYAGSEEALQLGKHSEANIRRKKFPCP